MPKKNSSFGGVSFVRDSEINGEVGESATTSYVAAVAARPPAAPAPPRGEALGQPPAGTMPRPRNVALQETGEPARQVLPAVGAANPKAFVVASAVAVAALIIYVIISTVVGFIGLKSEDLQYGRPRTFQMDAFVGHNEGSGTPSHFIALNLNRQVSIIQLPGGDVTKARAISGPYLFGNDGDLTPVTLEVRDVNADSLPDLLVNVKGEQIVYLNSGTDFRLITQDERAAIGAAAAGK